MKQYLVKQVKTIFPESTVQIGNVVPIVFPPGIGIEPLYISESGKPLIHLDFLGIYPRLSSVFFKQESSFKFFGKLFGGTMEGSYKELIHQGIPKPFLSLRISDIRLANIPALNQTSSFMITGILKGQLDLNFRDVHQANLKLEMSNGQIDISNMFLGKLDIGFDRIDSVIVQKDSTVEITHCQLHGKDMDISLSGKIWGGWPPADTRLEISGYINPHHGFLKNARNNMITNFFPDKKVTDQGFSFAITGNFNQPVFLWN